MHLEAAHDFLPNNDAAPDESDKSPNESSTSMLNVVGAVHSEENKLRRATLRLSTSQMT